jgi:hypothetical protein
LIQASKSVDEKTNHRREQRSEEAAGWLVTKGNKRSMRAAKKLSQLTVNSKTTYGYHGKAQNVPKTIERYALLVH